MKMCEATVEKTVEKGPQAVSRWAGAEELPEVIGQSVTDVVTKVVAGTAAAIHEFPNSHSRLLS